MEHRWSVRKPMQGSVTFSVTSWGKAQANIFDISIGGLAISNQNRQVPINSIAMLSFSLERDGHVSYHRLSAQVAHCEETRIGFLFMEPGDEVLRELRDMLYPPGSKFVASSPGAQSAA